jgi:hypothetical protein
VEEVIGGIEILGKSRQALTLEEIAFEEGELVAGLGKVIEGKAASVANDSRDSVPGLQQSGKKSKADVTVGSGDEKVHEVILS